MVDVILAIIWIAILVLYIVVGWKDAKSNNEVKKEITQMNELLLEQNSQLKEQNKHLNMVTDARIIMPRRAGFSFVSNLIKPLSASFNPILLANFP